VLGVRADVDEGGETGRVDFIDELVCGGVREVVGGWK
jgi:hypothetical protein